MKPRAFIGSSAEQLGLAYAVQDNLEHDVEATVWTQGVFDLSRTAMASLIDQLDDSDFGFFVLSPDDVSTIRKREKSTVRDNVIFELGLFVGRLNPERCFLIVPSGVDDLHLPTDLIGMTPAMFASDRQDGNLHAALGPACNRIRKSVKKLGRIDRQSSDDFAALSAGNVRDDAPEELTSDPVDCEALIRSWIGAKSVTSTLTAIRYADVDRELKLATGSAEKYIEKAAHHFRFEPDLRGKATITFKKMKSENRIDRAARHSAWMNR